jgi:hypothetical protein
VFLLLSFWGGIWMILIAWMLDRLQRRQSAPEHPSISHDARGMARLLRMSWFARRTSIVHVQSMDARDYWPVLSLNGWEENSG